MFNCFLLEKILCLVLCLLINYQIYLFLQLQLSFSCFKKFKSSPFLSLFDKIGFLIGHLMFKVLCSTLKFFHFYYFDKPNIYNRIYLFIESRVQNPCVYKGKIRVFKNQRVIFTKVRDFFLKSTATSKILP